MSRPSDFAPARILEIEIGLPLAPLSAFDCRGNPSRLPWGENTLDRGQDTPDGGDGTLGGQPRPYQRAIAIVFLHDRPLGAVEFQFDHAGVSAEQCSQQIWRKLHRQINEHLLQDGLPPVTTLESQGLPSSGLPPCIRQREQFLAHAPFVSIVIPTHDRPEQLKESLRLLLDLRYPRYEILVVDNAPSSNATYQLVHQTYGYASQIQYLREDIPGISRARNLGIAHAQGEIIAFTDDDVAVHPNWLTELVRGFTVAEKVGAVTGCLLPMELETPAQFWCEENRGFPWFQGYEEPNGWFERRIFDSSHRHQHLYRIGLFGCGASMAFKAATLRSAGAFDPALGSQRCAAEDVATLFRILMHGYKVVYEPASVLYHLHRREYYALRQQLYSYGTGLTAYLIKNVLDYPQLLLDLCTKVPYDLLVSKADQKQPKSLSYPKELSNLQVKGILHGPIAYLQSWWIESRRTELEQPTSPRLPAQRKR